MSLFGETCERWQPTMFATPQAHDAQGGSASRVRRFGSKHGGRNLSDETVAGISPSSPQAIPVSHSHSPGSDWARRMTATYGRKLGAYWLSCDPPDSWVRTLLGTSTWASMTCYLTWKRSATPQGRLLFRLVPSTPRTAGIASGLWGTPTSRDHKDTGNMENVPVNGLLGRQVLMPTPRVEGFDAGRHRGKPDSLHSYAKMWTTPRASENELRTTKPTPSQIAGKHGKSLSGEVQQGGSLKLNSAWVSRMMGYPDDWLILDGEATR
jgi:hypothetical protein